MWRLVLRGTRLRSGRWVRGHFQWPWWEVMRAIMRCGSDTRGGGFEIYSQDRNDRTWQQRTDGKEEGKMGKWLPVSSLHGLAELSSSIRKYREEKKKEIQEEESARKNEFSAGHHMLEPLLGQSDGERGNTWKWITVIKAKVIQGCEWMCQVKRGLVRNPEEHSALRDWHRGKP